MLRVAPNAIYENVIELIQGTYTRFPLSLPVTFGAQSWHGAFPGRVQPPSFVRALPDLFVIGGMYHQARLQGLEDSVGGPGQMSNGKHFRKQARPFTKLHSTFTRYPLDVTVTVQWCC